MIIPIIIGMIFPSSAAPIIINSSDTVVFDLSQATCTSGLTQIPVSILSVDSVYTLDFSLKYDHTELAYDSITKLRSYISESSYYNPPDSTVRMSSYNGSTFWAFENNTGLVSVYFDLLSGQINSSYLNSIKAFLNGDSCSVKIIDAISTTGITPSGPTTFNTGDSVSLRAASGTGYTYLWSTGDTAQAVTAKITGTYSVAITNSHGCSTDFSMRVDASLPIELISFHVKETKEGALNEWTTASEINNDYFTIERAASPDPSKGEEMQFITIGEINGAGNSTVLQQYQFTDTSIFSLNTVGDGLVLYYRLKQTDFDGTSTYSETEALRFSKQNQTSNLVVFPNPIHEHNISFNLTGLTKGQSFKVKIFNSIGTQINDITFHPIAESDNTFFQLQLDSDLPFGIYLFECLGESIHEVRKLILE